MAWALDYEKALFKWGVTFDHCCPNTCRLFWTVYGLVIEVIFKNLKWYIKKWEFFRYGNNGCDGGEDFRAYQWMMKHGGIPTEEGYGPYLGQVSPSSSISNDWIYCVYKYFCFISGFFFKDGYCHADKVPKVAPITGYVNVTSGDENALKLAIFKHGPISVAIDAGHKTFSFYSNGIYYEPTW